MMCEFRLFFRFGGCQLRPVVSASLDLRVGDMPKYGNLSTETRPATRILTFAKALAAARSVEADQAE